MSRIGRIPVAIPAGVTVSVADGVVTVKGPLGELKQEVKKDITVTVADGHVSFARANDLKKVKAMHGLYRTLVFNMIEGVTKGFSKTLIINGVGYKAEKKGNKIVMNLGFSHPVEFAEVEGITFDVPKLTEVVVKGIDKDKVGQTAANIKATRKIEPYHGYGIRYAEEAVVLKEGKKAGK